MQSKPVFAFSDSTMAVKSSAKFDHMLSQELTRAVTSSKEFIARIGGIDLRFSDFLYFCRDAGCVLSLF